MPEDPPRRISPATAFFALLALALAIALYVKSRPAEQAKPPERRPPPRHAAKKPPVAPPGPTAAPEPTARPGEARIAIVIDDLGNDREALERIARWPYAVAGAVLPGLPGSADAARRLAGSGKEVLLHLPMEPDGYPEVRPGPGVVLRSDTDERITQIVTDDLASVPGAVGVNNHMGSAATADARVMRAVVRVLARRGLFLLDSRTTEATVARRVAEEASLPAVSRRIFLDAVTTDRAIGRAYRELLAKAKQDGSALAIGHPHPATLGLLERELPLLGGEGVQLVRVSDLASRGPKSKVQSPKSVESSKQSKVARTDLRP
ncbi:MAG TPA: divergent polysaccharide deacetylase family protein [Thermoanaerobaculia bacterium]|nr:divergent polysaccharide deacetylase family protein [Thermoanaerobaculia bacterium]